MLQEITACQSSQKSHTGCEVIEVKIDDIQIGQRHRKDFGDLAALAASIEEVGLLQPIGVTPESVLVFGERRLLACRDILGWATILARVVDLPSILAGEVAENMHKAWTVSEKVAVVAALRSYGHGGDRRSDQVRNCELEKLTVDKAAKRVGLGGKEDFYRAKAVVASGVPELVAAMDKKEISIYAAAEIAALEHEQQRSLVAKKGGHDRWTAGEIRKLKKLAQVEERQREERKAIAQSAASPAWTITADQTVVRCDLLITDPPQGILRHMEWDNTPEGIEAYTRDWCRRWSSCGAHYIVVFWNQRTKWQAKRWFDESLAGYEFLQECCCHRRNYKKPEGVDGTHKHFRNSWEPVFVYRRKGCDRDITQSNHALGCDLTDDDHHSASYPTMARNDADFQQHPCQKPVSAMRWLIHGLTLAGEKVVDCFCGSGASGIAAVQLGRKFHGIEINEEHRRLAEARLAAYGSPDPVAAPADASIPLNGITHGDCLDLIPRLPNRSINLVLTSPPYAQQRDGHYPGVPEDQYPEYTLRWMAGLWSKLKDDGSVLIVIDPHVEKGVTGDYVLRTQLALRDAGWKQHRTQIWFKPDPYPIGHKWWPRHSYEEILWFSKTERPFCDPKSCGTLSEKLGVNGYLWSKWSNGSEARHQGVARTMDVLVVPVGANQKGVNHPAQFPVALAEAVIQTFCPVAGTVVDNYCGSGSTLVAAKKLGRHYYGFDLVADYCQTARKRLDAIDNGSTPTEVS